MSFIEFVSNHSAKWLAKKVPNDKYPTVEDQIEVFTYGFMVVWGAIFKAMLMVSLASIFSIKLPTLIIALTFSSLRIIAGGYHFGEYNKCITFSTIQFIGSALLIKYTLQYWSFIDMWYLFNFCVVMTMYIIYRYVPRDTPNKPITELLEIKKFKRWSSYYLFIWTIIMTISLLFNLKIIVISSCFGLLLELFSISRIGQIVYSALDSKIK